MILLLLAKTLWLASNYYLEQSRVDHRLTPLVMAFSGPSHDPRFAPKGDLLLFHGKAPTSQFHQLYLKFPDSETPVAITDSLANHWLARWAPDGKTMLYAQAQDDSCTLYQAILSDENTLSAAQPLLDCQQQQISDVAWRLDQQAIFFAARATDPGPLQNNNANRFSIYQYHIDSKQLVRLTGNVTTEGDDFLLSHSPDGQWLAYVKELNGNHWQYHVYHLATGTSRLIAENSVIVNAIAWAPDNQSLVVAGNTKLWRLSLTGIFEPLLANDARFAVNSLDYSPTSGELIVAQAKNKQTLWQYQNPVFDNKHIENPAEATTNLLSNGRNDFLPRFANTSKALAFVSFDGTHTNLMIRDPNGTTKVLAEHLPYDLSLTQLDWSPDDQYLAFAANDQIYLLNSTHGRITPIFKGAAIRGGATWSNNGDYLYFSAKLDGDWQIWRINRQGEDLTRITQFGGVSVRESNNSDAIYYAKYGKKGLWRRSLNNKGLPFGPEKLLITDFDHYAYISWQVFEHGIYYLIRDYAGQKIVFFSFASEQSTPVLTGKQISSNFSVSADQRDIALMHTVIDSELALLLNPSSE